MLYGAPIEESLALVVANGCAWHEGNLGSRHNAPPRPRGQRNAACLRALRIVAAIQA